MTGCKAFWEIVQPMLAPLDGETSTGVWRRLDPDKLITRNPAFWELFYETMPGDTGLAILQAGTLLAAGDSVRADIVLRLSFAAGTVNEKEFKVFTELGHHAEKFHQGAADLVTAGIARHDAKDFKGAIAKYDEALTLCPRYGLAFYERGFSKRSLAEDSGQESPASVLEDFASCRRLNPFEIAAWQGSAGQIPGMMGMLTGALPFWKKLNLHMSEEDQELVSGFARQLQEAKVDDVALLTRQLLVVMRGHYAPEDHPFISKSLRRLVPGAAAERSLERLGSRRKLQALRIWEGEDPAE